MSVMVARARGRRSGSAVATVVAVGLAGAWLASRDRHDEVRSGSRAAHGAQVVRYKIHSRFVNQSLPQTAAVPVGSDRRRPLLIFLHGRGDEGQESNTNTEFFRALRNLGANAPIVLFPSGGVHSYFHQRRSGDWARYVLDEVIPVAARRLHADPRRVAIGGISMGGFGAYDIARLRPGRFCAVGGHSAALWLSAADSAPGAFDDAADFERHDVVTLARLRGRTPWGQARLWLDGGTDDPFRHAGEVLADALGVRMHHWPGGHDQSYWKAHYLGYLRFYADALAACHAATRSSRSSTR